MLCCSFHRGHESWSLLRVHRLFQWARELVGPGEITLGRYLLFAFIVRLPAIFLSRGYDFLDHQFQYVDPAYHLAFHGSWWRPHEYTQGLRSWVYPGLLAGIFKLVAGIGITEPSAMMAATRFVHGLISLLPLAALWTLVVRWKGWKDQRPLLLFVAANALVVYSGIQPTGPTFAVGLTLTSVFLFYGPGRWWTFLSGLLLGLAFACRFQDAFFGPVLLVAGLLQKRWNACWSLSLGTAITVSLQGIVDWLTWGGFLYSPFRYVEWNVFQGQSQTYGAQPAWLYAAFVALVLVWVPPFLKSGWRAVADGSRKLPLLVAAGCVYILLHNLIARKAFRFIIPALVLLLVAYSAALLWSAVDDPRLRRIHRRVFVGLHVLALVLVSVWYPNRGPVEAALALGQQEDFHDRLLVVDGAQDAVGGHYYLRRPKITVDLVARRNLAGWFRAHRPVRPLYVLVVGEPLPEGESWSSYRLERVGEYHDWPDTRRGARRFLYRAVR